MSSKVYFTDFRCKGSDSRLAKLDHAVKLGLGSREYELVTL